MAARKREIQQIMRNDPNRLSRIAIRLSNSSSNTQIETSFTEVWLDDKYQPDMLYCEACKIYISRQQTSNFNLIRHLNSGKHKQHLASAQSAFIISEGGTRCGAETIEKSSEASLLPAREVISAGASPGTDYRMDLSSTPLQPAGSCQFELSDKEMDEKSKEMC